MAGNAPRWTLEDLVDFEQAAASPAGVSDDVRETVATAIRGLEGAEARRAGLRVWLEEISDHTAGRKFASALAVVGGGLAFLTFVAGISATLGLLDRERGGINVTLFLAILLGGQWLVLLLALFAWLTRAKTAGAFSSVQAVVGKLARRLAGGSDAAWWDRAMEGAGSSRAVIAWRLARIAQAAGISFNLGILAGLAGLVLVRHVGFFWETTTELAMRAILLKTTAFLSAPWSALLPSAVPDGAVVDASRWLPGTSGALSPGPAAWWEFLLMVTLVWGLLPRAILWLLAWKAGGSALAKLDFQARHHRALWREVTGHERTQSDEKPLDGVLVLDVGGSGVTEESLRPFLLRRLRVHPAAWQSVAVLDAAAERQAAKALANAPAGVVLLAEGWSLSPPRMVALHASVRSTAGAGVPLKFLIFNSGEQRTPVPAEPAERLEWERFVDSLRDPAAEVFFFETPQDGL